MVNLITIDVEEWFQTSALRGYIREEDWEGIPSRLTAQVELILDILSMWGVHATFFVLGWVAERYPSLVKSIAARGHEIASHGYRHRLVYNFRMEMFQEYVSQSKKVLEDLVGQPVIGYRAASFSIVESTLWALDVIQEAGFIYDSSMFPIKHDIYGIEGIPRYPFVHKNGLIEIPPSTFRLFGKNIPVGGGGYFRLYPYWLTNKCFNRINMLGIPAMIYLHPWELDPDCPRLNNVDWRTRFRQYVNLDYTKIKLMRLLENFKFVQVKEFIEQYHDELKLEDCM